MVEIKLTVANEDLDTVLEWIEDTEADLTEDMIASRPTRLTEHATKIFVLLENMRRQVKDFQVELARKEAEARRG